MTKHSREISCAEVRRGIARAIRAGRLPTDLERYADHVSACALCRGALTLLLSEAGLSRVPPPAISCEHSLAELPAFVDAESDAPAEAARLYPHVLWHLWTCEECAETYMLTRALVAAEAREPFIPAPPAPRQAPERPSRPLLSVSRAMLNHLLAPPPQLFGAARGAESEQTIIADERLESGRRLTIGVSERTAQEWQVTVTIVPPMTGSTQLTLGAYTFRARFDADGAATAPNIPAALLTAPDGPELVISYHPE